MREKLLRFMQGRHGLDALGRFLNIITIILLLISMFFQPLVAVSFALIVYTYFRVFSRSTYKRSAENAAYLRVKGRVTGWIGARKTMFQGRKTTRFFKCPACHQLISIPKGKGKITITCPKCRERFSGKS